MSSSDPPLIPSPSWRTWLLEPRNGTAVLSLVALVAVLMIWQFRAHLTWRFGATYAQVDTVLALPIRTMPETVVPEGWIWYEAGGVEFCLPADMVLEPESQGGEHDTLQYLRGDDFSVVVNWTDDASHWDDLLTLATAMSPESKTFTAPELRLEFYRASASDFSWMMTKREVLWHVFLMTVGKVTRLIADGEIESHVTRDIESILHFGDRSTTLEWHCLELPWNGYLYFHSPDEQPPANRDWVRAVAASLRPIRQENPVPKNTEATLNQPEGEL